MVRLCKVSNVAGTFDFDVTTPAGASTAQITVSAGQVNTPVCIATALFNSDLAADASESVTITEDDPGAGWSVMIDIDQYYISTVDYGSVDPLGDTFNNTTRSATVVINDDLEKVVTFNNTFTAGTEGCTPGYWKQSQHFDSWPAPYTQNTLINTALETTIFPSTMTLLQALGANGGGINALARHAAAALLNAASGGVDYPMSVADVLAAIDTASGNIEGTKNTFAANNELGCPLN